MERLDNLGLIEEDDGARVIFVEGVNIPIIAVKRDGGYNYSSTDLAALWLVCTFSFLTNTHILLKLLDHLSGQNWLSFISMFASLVNQNRSTSIRSYINSFCVFYVLDMVRECLIPIINLFQTCICQIYLSFESLYTLPFM